MITPVALPEVDFPHDSPYASRIVRKLEATRILAVPREPMGPAGACYWNVEACVRRHGGWAKHGWLITWIPNLYIDAMHHAVWRTPQRDLLDVTAPQHGAYNGTTTFVPGPQLQLDLRYPVMIPNTSLPLVQDELIEEMFECYRANIGQARLERDRLISQGHQWRNGEWIPARPFDPELRRTFVEMHGVRARVRDKYGSTWNGP